MARFFLGGGNGGTGARAHPRIIASQRAAQARRCRCCPRTTAGQRLGLVACDGGALVLEARGVACHQAEAICLRGVLALERGLLVATEAGVEGQGAAGGSCRLQAWRPRPRSRPGAEGGGGGRLARVALSWAAAPPPGSTCARKSVRAGAGRSRRCAARGRHAWPPLQVHTSAVPRAASASPPANRWAPGSRRPPGPGCLQRPPQRRGHRWPARRPARARTRRRPAARRPAAAAGGPWRRGGRCGAGERGGWSGLERVRRSLGGCGSKRDECGAGSATRFGAATAAAAAGPERQRRQPRGGACALAARLLAMHCCRGAPVRSGRR